MPTGDAAGDERWSDVVSIYQSGCWYQTLSYRRQRRVPTGDSRPATPDRRVGSRRCRRGASKASRGKCCFSMLSDIPVYFFQIDQRGDLHTDDHHHLFWFGNILLQDGVLWIYDTVPNHHFWQVFLSLYSRRIIRISRMS